MANRDIVYGIRITGDATSAVVEAKKVDKAFDEVAATLDHVESAAGTAQAAMTGVVSPAAVAGIKAGGGAANEAAGHVARLGVSAGQTAQAMRQLPMQFTDIFTSLAAGMPPMQVLFQQGGQLKDSFGGAGAAAKAMGGYVAGLVGPFTLAAAGVGVLTAAWVQGSSEAEAYEKTLAITGYRAGVTASELSVMAESIGKVSGNQGSAAEILNQLAGSGKVAAGQMEEVGAAIAALSETGARDVETLVKEFAAIAEDPVKGILKVGEAYNFLTPSIYGQVKALQEQGKLEEAIALAQSEFAKAAKQRAVEVEAATGAMERGWRSLVNVVQSAWSAMKDVGRESLQQQVAAQKRLVEEIRSGEQNGDIGAAQRYLVTLEGQVAAEKKAAEGGAARAATMKGFLATEKEVAAAQERGAKQTRTLTQALGEYRENLDKIRAADPKSVMLDPAKVAAGEAAIRKEFETTAKVRRAAAATPGERLDSTWVQRIQVLKAQASATESLTETERAAIRVMTDFANGKLKLTAAEKARLPGLVQEALLLDDAAEAAKKAAVEQAALAKAQEAAIDAVRADTQALLAKLDAAKFEAETYGMTEEAVYRLLAARAEDRAEMNAFGDANDAIIAELKAQAKAYRDLADAAGAKASRDAVRKAGEDARASAQRFSDDLERALTDSLMRSFEAGKGFGEAFLDSIKNMLKTAALKAVVQVIAEPVTGRISGVSAGSRSGVQGSTGGMGGFNMGSGASMFDSFAMSSTGQSLGLSNAVATDVGPALQLSESAASISQGMSALAEAAPYIYAAYQGFAEGKWGRAVGTAIGAYFGGPIGAYIGGEIGGTLDHTPTYHKGGAYTADTSGGGQAATNQTTPGFNLGWGAYTSDRTADMDNLAKQLAVGTANQAAAYLGALGGDLTKLSFTTRFASDNNDWSEGAIQVLDEAGNKIFEFTKRYTADAAKAAEEFGADTSRALLAALRETDLADIYDAMFDAVDPMKASAEEITAVLQRASAIQTQIAQITAGIDSAFKTPVEQLDAAFAQLSIAAPATTAEFEALVLAQDLTTDAGRNLAASLMSLYPAFSQIQDAVGNQAAGLQQRIWQLTGDTKAIREAELAKIDPANRALQERVWALEDEQSAHQAMASAISGVSAASSSAVDSLASLSDALHSALGSAGDETASASAAARARAQAQLGSALAIAKASGGSVLPDEAAISGALGVVGQSSTGMFGSYEEYLRDRLRTANTIAGLASIVDTRRGIVPGFASGGSHSGGWRVVGENGPELEYTGPSQIVSNGDSKSLLSLDEVIAELRALRDDMRTGHVAISQATSKVARLQAQWDVDGLPGVRA